MILNTLCIKLYKETFKRFGNCYSPDKTNTYESRQTVKNLNKGYPLKSQWVISILQRNGFIKEIKQLLKMLSFS